MNNEKQIIIATGNQNKLKEFQDLLKGYNVKSVPVDTKEIQGTGEAVIREKARQAYLVLKKTCIVDDTNFCFDEWNGLPGPYIKDFVKAIGCKELALITKNKNATVKCFIALADSENDIKIFVGETRGKIVEEGKDNGFDFDRIFIPDGHSKRYSEMTFEEKNKVSHRMKAILKLKEYLDKNRC